MVPLADLIPGVRASCVLTVFNEASWFYFPGMGAGYYYVLILSINVFLVKIFYYIISGKNKNL